MPFDPHPNFAVSTVATAPDPATSGTSLTVASTEGARFPESGEYNATVHPAGELPTPDNAEIVRVTARSGDVLTITRAQEGSSARTIVVGDMVYAAITAKTLTDIEASIPLVIVAQDDEIVNNSATLQNDDELFVPVGANEVWMFRLSLLLQQTTGANPPNGWRHAIAIPSGATANRWVLQDTQAFGIDATGATTLSQTGTALYAVNVMYRLVNGANPGTFQHQWAQNVAHASDSFRRRGSMLRGWRAV